MHRGNAVSKAIGDAKFRSHSHYAVIGVLMQLGDVIETHEHAGEIPMNGHLA
jgi:hypothetical protein